MAISFVGGNSDTSSANADTNVSLTALTGGSDSAAATGDLVIFAYGMGDADNVNLDVLCNTAGFSEIADLFGNGTQDANLGVFYKFMGATPDTTVQGEGSTGGNDTALAGIVMVFRGVDQTSPFRATATTATGTTGGNPDPPSISGAVSGDWCVIAGCSANPGTGSGGSFTNPTNYTTNSVSLAAEDTTDVITGMGYRTDPANPENPGAMTQSQSGTGWAAVTMLLAPAPSATIIDGVALTTTPSLPAGSLRTDVRGVALTTTPTLPAGGVQLNQTTGVVLTTTPSLPAGSLSISLTGVVLTTTPTLPSGSLSTSLTGVVLDTTPTAPAGTLNTSLTGIVLTTTPTLETGAVAQSQSVIGVALETTPTLPAGALSTSVTGVALETTPELPTGQVVRVPTLAHIDGFEHQVVSNLKFGGGDDTGLFDFMGAGAAAGVSFPAGRTGGNCIEFASAGSSDQRVGHYFPTSSGGHNVASLYFRYPSHPSTQTIFLDTGHGPTGISFLVATDGSLIGRMGPGTDVNSGIDVADNQWHLLDFWFNTTANPWTVDWQIDGVAQTQNSLAQAADTTSNWQNRIGRTSTSPGVAIDLDDWVISKTAGDYPIGDHTVYAVVPDADGTHNAGTNVIEANGGADIGAVTAFDLIDEWPPNTSDYIQQAATGTGNYAEVVFPDTTKQYVWGVRGYLAAFASSTAANQLTVRVVDSAGTTITNIISTQDVSETALHYRSAMLARPANLWTPEDFNGLKVRVGFSGDVLDVPRLSAVQLQYAIPGAGAVTQEVTGTTLTTTPSLPAGSAQVASVGGVVLTTTPTLPAGSLATTITGITLTTTPTLPAGILTVTQSVTGVTLTTTPTLPQGSAQVATIGGVTLTTTPTLPVGAVTAVVTGVVLTVTPTLPVGSLNTSVTGIVLTTTPTLPAGSLDIPTSQITGVVLETTPSLPAGFLNTGITGITLTSTPSFVNGALVTEVKGLVLTTTPTLPKGSMTVAFTVRGVTLQTVETFPKGSVTGGAIIVIPDPQKERFDRPAGTVVVKRTTFGKGQGFTRRP